MSNVSYRAVAVSLLLGLCAAAAPAAADEPGEPYLVRDIDTTGDPWFEECNLSACLPPVPLYGALIEQLTPLGDRVVFVANDRGHGFELWVSDGTQEGTRLLADTCVDCGDVAPQILGVVGDRLYFAVRYGVSEANLWVTDGTPEGTWPLEDLCPGLCQTDVVGPGFVFQGSIFFRVYERGMGWRLWRSDGTAAGTAPVQPVLGCCGTIETSFVYGGRLFYSDGAKLYRIDSPAEPPVVAWQGEPDGAARLGDREVLAVNTDSLPSLWILDSPLAAAREIVDLGSSQPRRVEQLTSVGDLVYFVLREGQTGELWRTDGTAAGTHPVASFRGRSVTLVGTLDGGAVVRIVPEPGPLPVVLPTLWWVDTDGPAEALAYTPVQDVAVVGARIFFSAEDADGLGRELFVSDGTADGTHLLADIAPGPGSSAPGFGGRLDAGFAAAGDLLFFPATRPDVDTELFALDLGNEEEPPPPPPPPPPPSTEWLESPSVPGFRVQVRITGGGPSILGNLEPACIPENLCVSGAVPGRSEVFVRVVGPKPNGFLWPTLVKFSTSRVEVWIEQKDTEKVRYYLLEGATPGVDVLPGLFDRMGFSP